MRTNTGIDDTVEGEKTLDILHPDLLRYADNAHARTDLIRRTSRYFMCVCVYISIYMCVCVWDGGLRGIKVLRITDVITLFEPF